MHTNTIDLYPRFVGAAIVVGILAVLVSDAGWWMWLGIAPALVMGVKVKKIIGD